MRASRLMSFDSSDFADWFLITLGVALSAIAVVMLVRLGRKSPLNSNGDDSR